MTSHLSLLQLTLLIGGAAVVALVLIVAVYALHKSFRGTLEPDNFKPPRVRVEDETAFTLATMQAVIVQLKQEQKSTQAKLVAAEQRTEENARRIALITQEIDQGLIVFDREGFLTQANPPARELLGPDTWSRRCYAELFESIPRMAALVQACFETGAETRKETIEYQSGDGRTQAIVISVLLLRDRNGNPEAVVCLLRGVSSAPTPPER